MSDRDWVNPATQEAAARDAIADGEPTPGKARPFADEPPGSPEWQEVDQDDQRRGDRDLEIRKTRDGRRGTSPRRFRGHDQPGSETGWGAKGQ